MKLRLLSFLFLLIGLLNVLGTSKAYPQLLCSEALKPAASTAAASGIDLSKEAENTVIVEADRLTQKLAQLIQNETGRRMDFEISEAILGEVAPVLEKNSQFVKQRAQIQADATENSYAKKIHGLSAKTEKNLLKLSQLVSQNKSLKQSIYGIIPGLTKRQIEKWSAKIRTVSGESQYLVTQLKSESQKFVDIEHGLAKEEKNLQESLEALKRTREFFQNELWPESQNVNSQSEQAIQNQKEVLLVLDKQINGIMSVIAVTSALRKQINSSLDWNKMAIDTALQSEKNTNLVSYVSKGNLNLAAMPYTPPVVAAKTAAVNDATATTTDAPTVGGAAVAKVNPKSNVKLEPEVNSESNSKESLWHKVKFNAKRLRYMLISSADQRLIYAEDNPGVVSFEEWHKELSSLQLSDRSDYYRPIENYLKKNSNSLSKEDVQKIIDFIETRCINEYGLSPLYKYFEAGITDSKRMWEINLQIFDAVKDRKINSRDDYYEHDIKYLLTELLIGFDKNKAQQSSRDILHFLDLIHEKLNRKNASDYTIRELAKEIVKEFGQVNKYKDFTLKDTIIEHEKIAANGGFFPPDSHLATRAALIKNLTESVLRIYISKLNNATDVDVFDRIIQYKYLKDSPAHFETKNRKLYEQIDSKNFIQELQEIKKAITENYSEALWNDFFDAYLKANIKTFNHLHYNELLDSQIYSSASRYDNKLKRKILLYKVQSTDVDHVINFYSKIRSTDDSKSMINDFTAAIINKYSKDEFSVHRVIELSKSLQYSHHFENVPPNEFIIMEYYKVHYLNLNKEEKMELANLYHDYSGQRNQIVENIIIQLDKMAEEYQARLRQNGKGR